MLARCIREFMDAEANVLRREGDEFEASEDRVTAINSAGYGELVAVVPEAPEAPEAPAAKPTRTRRRTAKESK